MAIPVILPRQGQSVETCAIIGWKKHVGEVVKTGEIICEVETDKASFEIESPADGTLLAIYHEAGSQVPVLATLAVIGKPGEKVQPPADAAPAAAAPTATAPVASSSTTASSSPAAPSTCRCGHRGASCRPKDRRISARQGPCRRKRHFSCRHPGDGAGRPRHRA